ncbi:MAG TPA: Ig-like domain-containing protein [Isosphaeraceae bacterium]|jgi:virginiamycin B lyase|nr:Ig-like domain-containing protein [Isosphaeraceae bacterium]
MDKYETQDVGEAKQREHIGARSSPRRRQSRRTPRLEPLESRLMMSVTINEFPTPTPQTNPMEIARGADGNLWFTDGFSNSIDRIDTSGHITEFRIPTANSGPSGITLGPDGSLWFSERFGNKIGRVTPQGHFQEFSIADVNHDVFQLTAGPDGNIWFTEGTSGKIGRITPQGQVTEFLVPTQHSFPYGIVTATDGNLWFTELAADKIGRITPQGKITEFALPSGGRPGMPLIEPSGIAVGPDGNLWFTEEGTGAIGVIIPSTGQSVSFPLPPVNTILVPGDFITIFRPDPAKIVTGPDGNLWFTLRGESQIGRITPSGNITILALPTGQALPQGIAVGADRNIWFTESATSASKIGQLVLSTVDPALSGQGVDLKGLSTGILYPAVFVGSFTDLDPNATADEYTATIIWGDGTIPTAALIRPAAIGTTFGGGPATGPFMFLVQGQHAYARQGSYLMRITVTDVGDPYNSVSVLATAHVTASDLPVTGELSPASDRGSSQTDGITNVNTPTFTGTATPGADVTLTLQQPAFVPPGSKIAISSVSFHTMARPDGTWSLTTSKLNDGTYGWYVRATNPDGSIEDGPPPSGRPTVLVIDTVAPQVIGASLNPANGQLTVTLRDDNSGLDPVRLSDPATYSFLGVSQGSDPHLKVTGVHAMSAPSGPFGQQVVILTINNGQPIADGVYALTIHAAALRDLAGNGLSGSFGGALPTSVTFPDTDFLGFFTVKNGVASPPRPLQLPVVPLIV